MDYHSDYSRVSKTMLGHFAKSPADFHRYYIAKTEQPPSPKRQMVIGSAVHQILLEKVPIDVAIKIFPPECLKSDGSINSKPANQFRADHPEAFCMKQADAEIVAGAVESVLNHDLGELIYHPEAVFETPQQWTCETTGLPCRMMADFFIEMDDHILAYDLKTTEDIYPGGIKRTCKTLKYWLQDAHYSAGLQSLFSKPVKFRFWFVEVKPPFRIAPYEYEPRSREIAVSAYQKMMGRLAKCYDKDEWPDEWAHKVNQIVINPWELDDESLNDETEMVAFNAED